MSTKTEKAKPNKKTAAEQAESGAAEKRRKLRRIEIKTRKLTNQIFSGSYHSAFKGKGISFSEVREYQFGDDVRLIDWNVTARNRRPFVKVFEEERELTLMLLIDVSQSSFFGTQSDFKNHVIAEISAILAFSAITNNDKVGVIFFSDIIELFIPPKKGKTHILRIISEIYDFHPKSKGTDLAGMLKYFNNVIKKKCIAFLVSDFIANKTPAEQQSSIKSALNIASKRHDFIGLHIYDEREAHLPDVGLLKVKDAENGSEFWVDTSAKQVRDKYAKSFAENLKQMKDLFGKSGAQLESIKTEDNYVVSLMNMFKKRELRRMR